MCEVLERVESKGREEGREEGRKEGREEGRFKLLLELVSDGTITIQKAAETAGMVEAAFKKKMNEM